MIDININKIKKSFGFKNVLNDVSFEISEGEKIALIGDNGCGKTTLLNIIAGEEKPDSGTVSLRKGTILGYLDQTNTVYENISVRDILYSELKEILLLERTMKKYENKMANDLGAIDKYLKAQEAYINAGGYEINTNIEKIAAGFKITDYLDKNYLELSGGEQRRVQLAALIIKRPNILLLDEPTNHLDINTLEWFENYLNKYSGTVLVVSHDRYFLDKVATKTILIENGNSIIFNGNYSYYLEENEARIDREFKEYKDQQKIILNMKKQIKQLEEFGRLAYPLGESFYRRAENIRKRLARIEVIDKPIIKEKLPINLDFNNRSGKDVLVIKDYDLYIENHLLINKINLKINYGDKVCIIGDNGCGKSTLIKKIINNDSGLIKIGSNVKIGYIPQIIEFDSDERIIEYAHKFFIGDESHLRSALNKFYFHGENVFKKLSKLSGGEKVRLKLFELIQDNNNFIILDEPTNHLDIYTKEILEEALLDFNGTLLFVSQYRYFINKLANKVFYINDHKITEYSGNYDYFINKKH